MQLEVFEGFVLVDIINDFVSFERNRCYCDTGQFTLELNSLDYKDNLQIGNYIMCKNEPMVIENIHQYGTGTNELRLEITGRSLSSILDRRVVSQFAATTAKTYEQHIYTLIRENFIQPTVSKRKIDCMRLEAVKGLTAKPTVSCTCENMDCLEVIKQLCGHGNLGFRINLYPEEGYFAFEVYQGSDLTDDVFFSEEYGNVSDSEIYEQSQDYKNAIYTSAEGVMTEVKGDTAGLLRREMISSSTDTGAILSELSERRKLSCAECSVILNDQFLYGEDWDIGDTITYTDEKLGFLVEQPVLEVKETYTDVFDIEVNFGDKIPTVFDKLGKR